MRRSSILGTLVPLVKKRPLVSSLVAVVAYATYDYSMWHLSVYLKRRQMLNAVMRGTHIDKPSLPFVVDRAEILNRIQPMLHPSDNRYLFQVVVGPLGCGKTWCITTTISKNPKVGVLTREGEIAMYVIFANCHYLKLANLRIIEPCNAQSEKVF